MPLRVWGVNRVGGPTQRRRESQSLEEGNGQPWPTCHLEALTAQAFPARLLTILGTVSPGPEAHSQ